MSESIDRNPRVPGPVEEPAKSALEMYVSASQVFLAEQRRDRKRDRLLNAVAVVAASTIVGAVETVRMVREVGSIGGALKEGAKRGLVMQGVRVNPEA